LKTELPSGVACSLKIIKNVWCLKKKN
jgi:hypothetical protein